MATARLVVAEVCCAGVANKFLRQQSEKRDDVGLFYHLGSLRPLTPKHHDSVSAQEILFQLPWERAAEPVRRAWRYNALTAELYAARAREEAWRREKSELLQRHDMLAQECEHRLANSLQIIVSLLSLQSRAANPDAAAQLNIAARRIASFGRVHRTLHLLDHQDSVEFKQYLQHLCEDLSGLLFQEETGRNIVVEAATIDLPTAVAVPLGFIVNELITNSAKYARSNITVRLETD